MGRALGGGWKLQQGRFVTIRAAQPVPERGHELPIRGRVQAEAEKSWIKNAKGENPVQGQAR